MTHLGLGSGLGAKKTNIFNFAIDGDQTSYKAVGGGQKNIIFIPNLLDQPEFS